MSCPNPDGREPRRRERAGAFSRRRAVVSTIADALVCVIVAPACAVCDALLDHPSEGPICRTCWNGIVPLTPPLCPVCGDPVPAGPRARLETGGDPLACSRCRGEMSRIGRSRAVGEYAGTLRALVHLLKYDRRRSLAPGLARLMADAGSAVLADADAVVPVPLHWTRRWRRGFNQASLLARGLDRAVWPALRRVRPTGSQVNLAAKARRANVRGAFAIARRRLPWHRRWDARLKGKVVVLVDDVSTTGATLEACASALLQAGVREVRALTAARVVGSPR